MSSGTPLQGTVEAAQAKKIQSLMQSIHSLQDQVRVLTASNKNHVKAAQIKKLQVKVRESELALDVLKQHVIKDYGASAEEVCGVACTPDLHARHFCRWTNSSLTKLLEGQNASVPKSERSL